MCLIAVISLYLCKMIIYIITIFNTISTKNNFNLVECTLVTGRTHQIRVHMSYMGHPVLGDPVYGGDKTQFQKKHPSLFAGQCLHAERLTLIHPVTGETMTFEADLPDNFKQILRLFGNL